MRLRIESLSHGRQQTKDLFHRYFARLLVILEADIVEYKSFRDNSYANLYYVRIFISCMVVCMGPYSCLFLGCAVSIRTFDYLFYISLMLKEPYFEIRSV